jgi:hypothetical protein
MIILLAFRDPLVYAAVVQGKPLASCTPQLRESASRKDTGMTFSKQQQVEPDSRQHILLNQRVKKKAKKKRK